MNRWTENELNILKDMYSVHSPIDDICKMIPNHPKDSIKDKAYELKLTQKHIFKNAEKKTYMDYDWCFDRYINKNMTMEEMADEINTNVRNIKRWCGKKFKLNERTYKEHKRLTNLQKELIMFSRLGDGWVRIENGARFSETHAENQKDYILWKYEILKDLCKNPPFYHEPKLTPSGNMSQPYYTLNTKFINDIIEIGELSYTEIINRLNEFGLSLFLLDDGHRYQRFWQLCISSYDEDEVSLLLNILKTRFNLDCKINSDGRTIDFSSISSKELDDIILRNIPNDLDIIQYKIINNDIIRSVSTPIYVIDGDVKTGLKQWFLNQSFKGKLEVYKLIRDELRKNRIYSIDVNDLYRM